MSYINPQKLKGNQDQTLSWFTETITFALAVLTTDSLNQFGSYIKTFRIVNLDPGANLQYRQGSATSPLKTVPPNSEVIVEGWESFVSIIPNAVTGNGYIEFDFVYKKDAEK